MFGNPIGPPRIWKKFEGTPGLMMSRSFGDKVGHLVGLMTVPEILTFDLEHHTQALVLGSDGLWEVLTDKDMLRLFAKHKKNRNAAGMCRDLVEAAEAGWVKKSGGGRLYVDDITCTVYFFGKELPGNGEKQVNSNGDK
jgi:serine/threonine protein phosphatase PrpC